MRKYIKVALRSMTVMSIVPMVIAAVSCSSNKQNHGDTGRYDAFEKLIMPFPVLDDYVYYPYIKVNKSGGYISDEMISKAVTNIVKGLTMSIGDISWGYHRDDKKVYIQFDITQNKKIVKTKTYELKLI